METVSSVTDQCVISPSLQTLIPMPLCIQICELDGKNFSGSQLIWVPSSMPDFFYSKATLPIVVSNEVDKLLMAASQQYEQSSQQYETYCTEDRLNELFLEASQLLNIEQLNNSMHMVIKSLGKQQVDIDPLDNSMVVKPSNKQQADIDPLDNSMVGKPSSKQQADIDPLDNSMVVVFSVASASKT